MTPRKPLDGLAITIMLVSCACWGLQQSIVKAAAGGMSPMVQMGFRSAAAAVLVYALIVGRGSFALPRYTWWPGVLAGFLFTAEFLAVASGIARTTASHMTVFLYTAPVFAAVGLHWLVPGERLRAMQWAGVLVAFAGIAVAFAEGLRDLEARGSESLLGDCLGVLGGLLWAATTVAIRRTALSEAPPTITLLYQLAISGAVLLGVSAAVGDLANVSWTRIVWISLFYQSVIVAFASYLSWFWMLRHYLASRLSVFSFLTPLFGVGFGVLLLDDPVSVHFGVGALLVIMGIVLVNKRQEP